MIDRTEAVILKTQNWAETSRIVHAFTSHFGRMKFLAKGARRPKSKYGAALETGGVSHIIFYRSRHSDLHTASEADIAWRSASEGASLDAVHNRALALEIAHKCTPIESPNHALYQNLLQYLRSDQGDRNDLLLFMAAALRNLGYLPVLDRCLGCGRAARPERWGLAIMDGGLVCPVCQHQYPEMAALTPSQTQALIQWHQRDQRPALAPPEARSLILSLTALLCHQLSDRVRLNSLRFLS